MPPQDQSIRIAEWERYKREHPRGTWVVGTVTARGGYGVWIDFGGPCTGCLEKPYIARDHDGALRDDELPRVGEQVRAMIRHYADDVVPGNIEMIALTQDPDSLWVSPEDRAS
jgi:hypothetical protein